MVSAEVRTVEARAASLTCPWLSKATFIFDCITPPSGFDLVFIVLGCAFKVTSGAFLF
jgi:hypothetical protein